MSLPTLKFHLEPWAISELQRLAKQRELSLTQFLQRLCFEAINSIDATPDRGRKADTINHGTPQ
jgi:hypothetical protein